MQVRGVLLVSVALFLGIAAFVLHLLAICSPRWKVTTRDRDPKMGPVTYGLWQRCEKINVTIMKQGVALGLQPDVSTCRPNKYMRYSPVAFHLCYSIRRNCAVTNGNEVNSDCSCRYLPSTKGLQWLTVLASICLALGLILLYLRTVSSPENASAGFLLTCGPFICFFLTLLLMVTGLILLGSYFRRDTYEDYSFPLNATTYNSQGVQSFDLHSLKTYAKLNGTSLSREEYLTAEKELRDTVDSHYHTVIGRATMYEIIATVLVILVTGLTGWLATASRSAEV